MACPHRHQVHTHTRDLVPGRIPVWEFVCSDCGEVVNHHWPCIDLDGRIEDKEARWL
ncbi:hypothetical protein SEA_DALANDE_66 [Gordonia phage DalanDe]|nr:hypothetical protein SEA_DALANDE_66 [Gordonia phage DalanDe]